MNSITKKTKCLTHLYQKPEIESTSIHFQDDFYINISEHQSEID